MSRRAAHTPVTKLAVSCYQVPTDAPESDGIFDWDSTTLVLVEATAGDRTGLGYSYTGISAGKLIATTWSNTSKAAQLPTCRARIWRCFEPFATRGADVLLEHYRGSYGQKVTWSPVILSGAMAVAGGWGALSHRAVKTVLR